MKRFFIATLLFAGLLMPVSAQTQLTSVAVVNAATYEPDFPVSPGCWASAFADFSTYGVTESIPTTLPFPNVLSSVQVLVNGVAAPMNYAGPSQINFLVPKSVPTTDSKATLKITVGGTSVYEGSFKIWPVSPGLLAVGTDTTSPAAAINQNGILNSQSNPAKPGEWITLFGIGADFASLPADGEAAALDPLVHTISTPKVYISLAEGEVLFSGLAPTLVNTWQLNVMIPDDPTILSGQVPVVAQIQGVKSNIVSIWVAR